MPRVVTALGGLETSDEQLPISLVRFEIPGLMNGSDIWGTAPAINHGGGYSAGASSIAIDGLGAGSIPSGSFFRIGLQWYVTTALATITANAATLLISPSLQAAVADNAILTTVLLCVNDVDATVYVNPTTNAVAMAAGAGLLPFIPYAGLSVPVLEMADDQILSTVSLSVSNQTGLWNAIVAANQYREQPVTIWQGNLVLAVGAAPDTVTFQGVVKMWAGRLESVTPMKQTAQIQLVPHVSPLNLTWPYRTYSAPQYKHLPKPGLSLWWGDTLREV